MDKFDITTTKHYMQLILIPNTEYISFDKKIEFIVTHKIQVVHDI